ncbi:hypothetical protein BCV70DRAFT_228595 [Testicularia cyperi]|uniref:Uncharacterized protein n=1 Tax=Testicularia cyperi TaxID=1882483 RepID=A0A317XGU2_9BASI|nr:hypothetical protein BCV70DRAFT_228595 [Testicularia cyperi]
MSSNRAAAASTATTKTTTTVVGGQAPLEVQSHEALIDHHAAHTQDHFQRSGSGRAPAAGLWQAPEPALGLPGGATPTAWSNPEWWSDRRGTPAYRPIDYNFDLSRRPWANGVAETIFTVSMIGVGVQSIGLANTAWRNTFGRFETLSNYFRYQCPHEL